MDVRKGIEFAIAITDRPGTFAQLIKKLNSAGLKIEAFMLYTSHILNIPDEPRAVGICKVLVDNVEEARDALKHFDLLFWEEGVLLIKTPDRPGLLLDLSERLSKGGVNIRDAYASVASPGNVQIVLSASDRDKALSLLLSRATADTAL